MSEKPHYSMSEQPEPLGPAPARRPSGTVLFFLFVAAVIVGLYVLALLSRGDRPGQGQRHPAVGKQPAKWELAPLTGDPPPISKEALAGKVTLVNFWGTWCPPCQVEFPHIVAAWEAHRDHPDFQLAAVSCEPEIERDIDALRATTAEFLDAAGTEMPTYYDPGAASRIALMDATGEGLGYPTTVLFDRSGKIRAYWPGYLPGMEASVEAAIKKALAE